MAKITVLEQKTFEGKPSGFKVTLDDGRSGNLQEKESTKGLRVGDVVDVKEIPYTSKKGVASTLYGLTLAGTTSVATSTPQAPRQQAPTVAPSVMKSDAVFKAMQLANEDYRADKCTFEEVKAHFHTYLDALWSAIDECK
jgi:hypothetical protein